MIAILGAGMAGLTAAYELQKHGLSSEIFEGSPRIGGRVWTHHFSEHDYGELGAMRIPSCHKVTLDYIEQLGLQHKLKRFVSIFQQSKVPSKPSGLGTRTQHRQLHNHPLTLSQEAERSGSLHDDFTRWILLQIKSIAPTELKQNWVQYALPDLVDYIRTIDISMHRLPESSGFDLVSILAHHPCLYDFFPVELACFLDDIALETSELYTLTGGLSQLHQRIDSLLDMPIRLDCRVIGISVNDDDVEVIFQQRQKIFSKRYTQILCTIPFSILRNIYINGLEPGLKSAIDSVHYAPATKVLFQCQRAFWREPPYSISGGGISITGSGGVYYPSEPDSHTGQPASNGSSSAHRSNRVLLASYTIGDDTHRIDAMTDRAQAEYIRECVATVHPELNRPGMLSASKAIRWGSYEFSQGACSVAWYDKAERARTHPARNSNSQFMSSGRLIFAGEHCSNSPAWIEGAIASANEAVDFIQNPLQYPQLLTNHPNFPVKV